MEPSPFRHEVEPDVVDALRRGDLAAFERIYRLFERPVYALACRLLGDRDAAHEVLQDAMLKAYERAGQYRGDAPFWAWLRQLAINEALMRLRRERRFGPEPLEAEPADEDAPPAWALADRSALERALAALPPATRTVLWLYHVEGLTHVEIAAHCERTVSYSKSQLARGTRRLRELLVDTPEASPCLIAPTA
ncbi:MAG TPA: RNA polymerase sigma factor [Mizugakiibacter sp.]